MRNSIAYIFDLLTTSKIVNEFIECYSSFNPSNNQAVGIFRNYFNASD